MKRNAFETERNRAGVSTCLASEQGCVETTQVLSAGEVKA